MKTEELNIGLYLQQAKTDVRTEGGAENRVAVGVTTDSRQLLAGELFVAIKGERFDGHDFVEDSLRRGAVAAVVAESEYRRFSGKNLPLLVCSNPGDLLMDLAGWYRSRFNIPVIGLTGSAGKTTVKEMLSHLLRQKWTVVSTRANHNNFIGVPQTLFSLNGETEMAVVEMGTNHPGEIARLAEIVKPTHAVITNIGSGHIGYFGSREAIYREKSALFEQVAENGTIVLNMDDEFLRSYSRPAAKIVPLRSGEEYRLLALREDGCAEIEIKGVGRIKLQVPGRHQAVNAALAALLALQLGLPPELVKVGLTSFQSPDKRMQLLEKAGIKIINDAYNANPESMKAALLFLNELPLTAGKKRYAALGDMLELGEFSRQLHREVGAFLSTLNIDEVLLLGPEMKVVAEKFSGSDMKIGHFQSHQALGEYLGGIIKPGDALLLKGSRGMAMEKILNFLPGEND
ncbi:MAG: UDP-N-acetylmuramoyl-tripeptide--D-alanyl-D-alanine ligase [Calditrichia bacterium]